MIARKTSLALLIPMLALLLAACAAGKKEYDIGMQINAAGKHKEAIAYLEQAVAKEPDNRQYRQALAEIRERLVQQYLQEARQSLGPDDSITMAAIGRAKAKLAEARGVVVDHAAVTAFAQQLDQKEQSLLGQIRQQYDAARAAMDGGEWVKAYFNLQQIQGRFPNYEDTFHLMNQVVDKGAATLVKQARQQLDAEDFKAAAATARQVLALQSDNAEARELAAQATERDSKDYFVQQAGLAIRAQQWDRAVNCYHRAAGYDPDDATLKRLIEQVHRKAGDFYVQQAKQQMADGMLFAALESYGLAGKYAADAANDFVLGGLREDLSVRTIALAERFKTEQRFGAAWFCYSQIKQINPSYPQIFFLIQDMEDRIRQRLKKSIAVFDFNSPSEHVDSGIIVANNLITYLFKNASGDIKILERENLKSILEEMKLGQIGVVSSDSAQEMGRVYGIDVAIMGSVLLFKVDSSASKGSKTVRYQVGTKIIDNIEFQNWQARNPTPTKEELARAPAAKKEVPEYAEKDYEVSSQKKVGFVQLSFRIVDVSTGENIQVKTIERKLVVEDEASAGLPEAGVKFDAMEIPTDTEMLQKMTDEVVAELGREALRPLQNLEQTYFKLGETHLRRRDALAAAESFVDAIFDERLKQIQNSPLSEQAKVHLNEIFAAHRADFGG